MDSDLLFFRPFAGILHARQQAEAELEERARLAAFGADVGAALTRGHTLQAALGQCCQAMVRHLGGDFASVWALEPEGDRLEMQADAGANASQLGRPPGLPVGRFRIGAVARDRRPLLLDLTASPARDDDKDWASRAGMVAFAGYPLLIGNRLVGVMAMYARKPLTETALRAMDAVADQIALGIDRARAADALRVSEERVRSLLENMLVGVITIDGRGMIESANPAAERMFGYGGDELPGRHFRLLVSGFQSVNPDQLLRRLYAKAIGSVTQWEGRRKDGGVFPFELILFEFLTPAGRRLAGCVRDVSERMEIERVKSEFTAMVSHELRTPLTCVLGYLDLLESGELGPLPERAKDAVTRAQAAAERLQALTNDILLLARLDAGKLELETRPVAVADVIRASVEAVHAVAEQEKVPIEVRSDAGAVLADRDRLIQVLVNLLSNAIKFSATGRPISISTVEGPSHVEVRVADGGRGIPAASLPAVFERFWQVESADSRRKGGAGLGLAICKAIVEQHGGVIGAESEPGQGSLFWFRVPSAAAPGSVKKQADQ